MRRREVISLLGAAAAAWPLKARAQQPALPVVGFVRIGSADANARYVAAFRKGLNETGYVEGRDVTIEYHWLDDHYDRVPALMADLVRSKVAVIATPGNIPAALAAKAATATIPIVFGVTEDPVDLALSPALLGRVETRPASIFSPPKLTAKRLRLLHDLLPKAVSIAVLVNPANASTTEATLRDVKEAAPTIGLQIQVLKASTIGEIDAAFAGFLPRSSRCPFRRLQLVLS